MKEEWYVLLSKARDLVDSRLNVDEAQGLLERMILKEDETKSNLARLLLARLHTTRADFLRRADDKAQREEQRHLAERQYKFLGFRTDDELVRHYAQGCLAFYEDDHDKARMHLDHCRRPSRKGGRVRGLFDVDYVKHLLRFRSYSGTEQDRARADLREEIYDQTEKYVLRLRRGTQKITARVKDNALDFLGIGLIVGGLGTALYLATPSTVAQEPQKQEAPSKLEEEVQTASARWERHGREVVLIMKYGDNIIPPTDIDRMVYLKKEKGKKEQRFEFIPEDDVEGFSRKIRGKRPIKYKAIIYLKGRGPIETEYLEVR